ncbi:hypothetical protein [Muricomes intestini]|jgi:hypothetical protein|uniref:hypothetical protein n=1 Tax=Muricomes intestini TaxID=1796634 RepID=UPI002FE0C3C6
MKLINPPFINCERIVIETDPPFGEPEPIVTIYADDNMDIKDGYRVRIKPRRENKCAPDNAE